VVGALLLTAACELPGRAHIHLTCDWWPTLLRKVRCVDRKPTSQCNLHLIHTVLRYQTYFIFTSFQTSPDCRNERAETSVHKCNTQQDRSFRSLSKPHARGPTTRKAKQKRRRPRRRQRRPIIHHQIKDVKATPDLHLILRQPDDSYSRIPQLLQKDRHNAPRPTHNDPIRVEMESNLHLYIADDFCCTDLEVWQIYGHGLLRWARNGIGSLLLCDVDY